MKDRPPIPSDNGYWSRSHASRAWVVKEAGGAYMTGHNLIIRPEGCWLVTAYERRGNVHVYGWGAGMRFYAHESWMKEDDP